MVVNYTYIFSTQLGKVKVGTSLGLHSERRVLPPNGRTTPFTFCNEKLMFPTFFQTT